MSEAQSGGLIRDQSPSNTTPARRESQRGTVEAQLQSGSTLLVNYIGLMFNLYF